MNRIFIRSEDKNEWERRTPVVPNDVRKIADKVPVLLEESRIRCIGSAEYLASGCQICKEADDAEVIVGIKEIPAEKIVPNKVYVFFSHCVKGQRDGISLLKTIMERKGTLIDYERIVDNDGKRLIAFGKHAGYAGAANALWLFGKRLKEHMISSSFQHFCQAIHYESVNHAKEVTTELGQAIRNEDNIYADLKPIIIGILGTGKVAAGALEIFSCLGGRKIKPEDLAQVWNTTASPINQIYTCVFTLEDLLQRKDGKEYSRSDYAVNPQLYESKLGSYLSYLSIVANGLYWDDRNPNFLTWDMLEQVYAKGKNPKLRVISDIACDMHGTLECNIKYTNIMEPYYYIAPFERNITDQENEKAIAILAEENYPAEFSLDASRYFSSIAVKLIENIAEADFNQDFENCGLIPEIRRAVITYHGKLTEEFQYLEKYLSSLE